MARLHLQRNSATKNWLWILLLIAVIVGIIMFYSYLVKLVEDKPDLKKWTMTETQHVPVNA